MRPLRKMTDGICDKSPYPQLTSFPKVSTCLKSCEKIRVLKEPGRKYLSTSKLNGKKHIKVNKDPQIPKSSKMTKKTKKSTIKCSTLRIEIPYFAMSSCKVMPPLKTFHEKSSVLETNKVQRNVLSQDFFFPRRLPM